MDILLGTDSRPLTSRPDGRGGSRQDSDGRDGDSGTGPGGSGPSDPPGPRTPAPAGPLAGVIPPGFAGRVTLTIPAALLGLAGRPGEMAGIGPIDPKPEANTPNRYQTGTSADPGIQHINVRDRCPRRVGNWCASRPLTRGSNWLIDDRQIRAARLPSCLI